MERIWNAIKGIGEGIVNLGKFIIEELAKLLKFLFVPKENFLDDKVKSLHDALMKKLPFVEQIKTIFSSFTDAISGADSSIPHFSFSYKGKTMNIFDFSMFGKYRKMVHGIILFCSYFLFIRKTFKRLPDIIGGI